MAKKRSRTKRLTDLELEIMQAVWSGEPLTVREVVDALSARRGETPAYTTIQTVMNILRDKGVLRAKPGPGRALVYASRLSREEATRSMTRDFVERLFEGSASPLLSHLIEHESLDRDTLAELKKRIETQLADEPSLGEEDA